MEGTDGDRACWGVGGGQGGEWGKGLGVVEGGGIRGASAEVPPPSDL